MSEASGQGQGAPGLNDTIRYTMWSVFRAARRRSATPTATAEAAEVEELFEELGAADVVGARPVRRRRACAPTPT